MIESSVSNIAMTIRAQQGQNNQLVSQNAAQDREQQAQAASSEPVSTSGVVQDRVSISSQPAGMVTRAAASVESEAGYAADRDDERTLQLQARQQTESVPTGSNPAQPYNVEAETMLGMTIDIQS